MAAATAVGSLAYFLMGAGAARADYGPATYDWTTQQGDVVCVGSDTVQVIGNFLADGDNTGDSGYNSGAGHQYKMISLDATPDANVRPGYGQGSTGVTPVVFDPTVYLRGGAFPARRPNGSGNGYTAMLNDVTQSAISSGGVTTTFNYPQMINCVRGSSLPSGSNETAANNEGYGGLRTFRMSTDNEQVAAVSNTASSVATTNAPLGLSRAQLVFIYSQTTQTVAPTWGSIPGGYTAPNPLAAAGTTGNCATCTIVPLTPQPGSGTRSTFLNDLISAGCPSTVCDPNTGHLPTYVQQNAEENDPTALTAGPDPADAIIPFSGDRLNLFNNGYFHNPHVSSVCNAQISSSAGGVVVGPPCPFPNGAALVPGVALLNGAPSSGAVYKDTRGLFVTIRQNDDNDPNGWNGGTKNWAKTLFDGAGFSGSFMGSPAAASLISGAGGTQQYLDCGINPVSGGACGNVVQ